MIDFFWDEQFQLGEESTLLTQLTWPNYLVEPSDIPEPSLEFSISEAELLRRMPTWGIRRKGDGTLIANASAVLISADVKSDALPAAGWRFAMEAFGKNEKPNCLCLLAANIHPAYRRQGLAALLLKKGKEIASSRGLDYMIGPVRPTAKSEFPELSMTEYLIKKNEAGETYDPWLRLHLRLGAELLNICEQSVIIQASAEKWREWTKQKLTSSGKYTLPQGLAPLDLDISKNLGIYKEPNVWVRYTLRR